VSKAPTAAEKRYLDHIRSMGCLVCDAPAEAHHVRGYADKAGSISKSHMLVVPLCPTHHRYISPNGTRVSVHDLGHQGFYQEWGIDLYAEAMRLADESQRREAA
jgi:Recombination enhancement, RecA-dependent nuclease